MIMAGGVGNRLRPLTKEMPKPMLPGGGKPLLETIVNQLSEQGITEIFISTFYKAEIIINHFGDGSNFGVRIHYLIEDTLTGTAGALSHLPKMVTPTLVINGDIITTVNFELMSNFHLEHSAANTAGAAGRSLLMVGVAASVLILVPFLGGAESVAKGFR